MQLVDIPEVGSLTTQDACAARTSAEHAQDKQDKKDKEANSKITNASASTQVSGAFAFGPENREVIH